jgi:hypothetical protein
MVSMKKNKEQILNDLSPFFPDIINAYKEGITQYQQDFLDRGIAVRSRKRSVANNVYDAILEKLKPRFENRQKENIFIREEKGVTFLQIHDYIIRLKKIDKHGRASNVITKNSENYYTPLFDCSLFNNEQLENVKGMNLTLGYIPNEARTEFSDLFLVAPASRTEIEWKQNLHSMELENKVYEFIQPEVKKEKRSRKIQARKSSLQKQNIIENAN